MINLAYKCDKRRTCRAKGVVKLMILPSQHPKPMLTCFLRFIVAISRNFSSNPGMVCFWWVCYARFYATNVQESFLIFLDLQNLASDQMKAAATLRPTRLQQNRV